ncbi:sodium-dependent glucose transporter 1A-like [Mercenaria mercenaria]|uniref:sodium-dependent glucose transporter 1A-like n=1 Tax=Mercenaria mercenaria TaxID=6596 RepID=UPI00234E6226|nr:sodium-dependent glucose transporter 1A-like [Mercenaria mercenaria]
MNVDDSVVKAAGLRNRGKLQKVVETGALVFSWIVMGMYAEVPGPTLIDLKYRLNTGYEELAAALSARGFGTFPGCIVGGLLVDKFSGWSHLMVALTLDVAAVAVVLMPWVPNVQYIWMLCFVSGFVQAIHNAAGTRISLNIWKDKSASPLILVHLGYGLGSFLTPLYSDPFLGEMIQNTRDSDITLNDTNNFRTTSISPDRSEETYYITNSKIEYAYAISGIATASLSVAYFVFQMIENKFIKQADINSVQNKKVENELRNEIAIRKEKELARDKESELRVKIKDGKCNKLKAMLQMINPASCAKGRFWYGFSILSSMFFHFGNVGGGQYLVSQFVRSFSIDQLKFSSTDGTMINTSYWISFSSGRFLFFVLAKWVSVKVLIFVETFGAMCCAVVMAIFANDNSIALWVLIQLVAFFWGPMWPTGVAWTDYHMESTGMGMASQMFGASVGSIFHKRLNGYLYDNIGQVTYLYHVTGSAVFGF